MQYNLLVVSDIADECARFRNAVDGDALKIYFGSFNYEKAMWAQTNALLNSGLLYLWFSIETLKKVHKISTILNATNANWVNNNINKHREAAKKGGGFDRTEVVQFVNFIEKQVDEARALLKVFIGQI